jgi:prepilin-type processing-associated H-X9-DG protein
MCVRLGVTRADVTAVIIIIAALVALLLPLLARQREQARRAQCEWNMTRLAEAVAEFESTFAHYPGYRNPAAIGEQAGRAATADNASWVVPLWRSLGTEPPAQAAQEEPDRDVPPKQGTSVLMCPADPKMAHEALAAGMSYVANCGLPDVLPSESWPADYVANGIFFDRSEQAEHVFPILENDARFVRQHDGLSDTIMLSESLDVGAWTENAEPRVGIVWRWVPAMGPSDTSCIGVPLGVNDPRYAAYHEARPSSGHTGGVNMAFCDGHVAFVQAQVDTRVFGEMMCPDAKNARWPGTTEAVFEPAAP